MFGTANCASVNKLVVSFLILFATQAWAVTWDASAQHAGFLGDGSIAVGFENEAHWFGMDLGIGGSQDYDGSVVSQYNLKMRFMPLTWGLGKWGILDAPYLGVQAMYSRSGDFFYKSPGQYPEGNYYDETSLRTAISMGIAWSSKQWSVFYELVLIDTDIISQYNTRSSLEYEQLFSAAVGIRYYFDQLRAE